jgi:hypothetical protein
MATDCNGDLTAAAKTWSSGLAGVTSEQIANGLRACCNDPESWPTLPMFKAKCTGAGINEYGLDYVPEYYRVTERDRLLPSKTFEERKEVSKNHLSDIKSALKGAKKSDDELIKQLGLRR